VNFQAGFIYPLIDPEHYDDDDHGSGYDHVAIDHDANPGDCYIHDAWVVNSVGEVHPGYNACPIPIRREDVDIARGRPLEAALPAAQSIFDSPFFR
jgi:hypothetical protein